MRSATVQSIVWAGVISLFCHQIKADDKPAPTPPGVVAYFHFAGADRLGDESTLGTLKSVWDLAQSKGMRQTAMARLSQFCAARVGQADTNKTAGLIQPLLEDLLVSETHLELRGQDRVGEWTLALRLNEDRANLWQTNLWQLLAGGNGGEPKPYTAEGLAGWTAKYPHHPGEIHLVRSGEWTVLAGGAGEIPTTYGVFPALKSTKRPVAEAKDYWWDGEIDFPKLAALLGKDQLAKYPKIHLAMASKGDRIRSQWKVSFPDDLDWPMGNWEVPGKSIRDPLISFTAIQGVGPLLSRFPIVKQLGLDSAPNQLFFWSQSISPFAQYWAAPLKGVTNALDQFMVKAAPGINTNLVKLNLGEVKRVANKPNVVWGGLPIVVPYLRPGVENNMLVGGLFPVSNPPTNPPPAGLFEQVSSRPNLVMYDWEITGVRIEQLRPLAQLAQILTAQALTPTDSPGNKWLAALQGKLGNTVTEVLRTSPRELAVTRSSQLGLSALELVALASWIENPGFPGWTKTVQKHGRGLPAPRPGSAAPAPAPAPNK